MLNNILIFFRSFSILAATLMLGWFIYDYVSTARQVGDYKADIAKWELKYNMATEAQKASEETIKKLRQDSAELMQAIQDWKTQYNEIDKQNSQSQKRIRQLENQNTEIRNVLRSRVPDAIWHELFPRSKKAGS